MKTIFWLAGLIVPLSSAGGLPRGKPQPPPAYMVDNTKNTHGVAPDHCAAGMKLASWLEVGSTRTDNPVITASNSSAPTNGTTHKRATTSDWWYPNMDHGQSPYAPPGYPVFRNVMDYGAVGDGVTDDTAAINLAASTGNRCGEACGSSSFLGAVVYFPPGTYMVSSPIIQYYYTVFVGDVTDLPTIKGTANFSGIALIDTDVYIPGGNGSEWYINQNQFFRQIRNFNIDLTEMANSNVQGDQTYVPTGIHWQVAQATSLQNINFNMPTTPADGPTTAAVGIFMENGSGGFMSDLTFFGGNIGFRAGSQQFTARGLSFTSCLTAISMVWDWGFTWKDISVDSCYVAIDATSYGGVDDQGTGSLTVLDSSFMGVPYAITLNSGKTAIPNIVLDNLIVENSASVVLYSGGATVLAGPSSGSQTIDSWVMGSAYLNITGEHEYLMSDMPVSPSKSAGLLDGSGNFFTQSKPQYDSLTATQVINVLDHGVSNDGTGDQTEAINSVLSSANGQLVFFPAGIYMVQGTVTIPAGSQIVGEAWSQIMGSGSYFTDISEAQVMVQVGNAGDVGDVQISDMLFTVSGPTSGAILMEWNIQASSQGSAAMWDSHFRVGGAVGSNLQASNCLPSEDVNPNCIAAAMLMHVTSEASGYFENLWAWVADHDMDTPAQTQISVFSARGILIESQGPTWFYASSSEHSVMYQYQLSSASNIYMGHMQTETPYFQPVPVAPDPFSGAWSTISDPDFVTCDANSTTCAKAWALMIQMSTDVFIYGAGFYSFFDNYDETCVSSETCQDGLIYTSFSQGIWIYDIFTKGAEQVVSPGGLFPALQDDDQNGYCTAVAAWVELAETGAMIGGSPASSSDNTSPSNVSIEPLSCTTGLTPTATFTLTAACASEIAGLAPDSSKNVPPGPSPCTEECDLMRQLTGTCCGTGGSISNPIAIPSGVTLPRLVPLPAGFTPSTPIMVPEQSYPANGTFNASVILPAGFTPPAPIYLPTVAYMPNAALTSSATLPAGYNPVVNLTVGAITYPAGTPLASPVTLPAGFIPPLPIVVAGEIAGGAALGAATAVAAGAMCLEPITIPAATFPAGVPLGLPLDLPPGAALAGPLAIAAAPLSDGDPLSDPPTPVGSDGPTLPITLPCENFSMPPNPPNEVDPQPGDEPGSPYTPPPQIPTPTPTPVSTPTPSGPITVTTPSPDCYAGTSNGQYSFDGPAALNAVDSFCAAFQRQGGTYYTTMEFDNDGNSVYYEALQTCSDENDVFSCTENLSNIINMCDAGTPEKHGGSVQVGCVWYEIQGSSGGFNPTTTPTPTPTPSPATTPIDTNTPPPATTPTTTTSAPSATCTTFDLKGGYDNEGCDCSGTIYPYPCDDGRPPSQAPEATATA